MKKRSVVLVLSSMLLVACGGGGDNPKPTSSTSTQFNSSSDVISSSTSSSLKEEKKNFENVIFKDLKVSYDGKEHILDSVSGAPEDSIITYDNRKLFVDVGTYESTATIEKEGYNTLVLKATLTILASDFDGLTLDDVSVTYDGLDHINDINLVGIQPEGTVLSKTVKDQDGIIVTEAINVGVYNCTIEVSNKNYNKKILTATLEIKAKKSDMPVFISDDGTIYFANGLDNKYLYSLKNTDVTRLDYSSPKEFNKYSSSKAIFISGTPLLNSVKEVSDNTIKVIYTDSNINDFVKYDDNIFYYSSNSIKDNKSGIYKVNTSNSDNEPIVTKVYEGKTDNLAIRNDTLYFTNKENFICKLNLTTNKSSIILNEKVHEFIVDNNKIYCTINGLINDYIGYIDLSLSNPDVVKLTDAAGEYLNVKNGNLYYNYTDLYSHVDPTKKGIWKIDLSTNKLTQIFATENVNGFDVESNDSIIYINTNDLHLYRYNISKNINTDLLRNFVIPEVTPINTGGQSIAVGNKVYYLNMYAGKTLYVYDEKTKQNMQLTSNKVTDFYIYGEKLYFNQVTMLTNNDLYCVDLNISKEAEKISTNDVRNMISDGTYIYATHYNWAGVSGGISRMKLDGSEYVKFSEINGAKNLTIKDNKLYFINCSTGQDDGNIEFISLSDISNSSDKLKSTNLSSKIKNVKQFVFDNNNIFYIYNGTIDNSIKRTSFDSLDAGISIASSKTNPNEIILKDGYVYYYSYAVSAISSAGFYKVNKLATADKTQELILAYDEIYFGSNFAITDSNKLYFLNYIPKLILGNAHTYQLDLNNKSVNKIA